MEAASTDNITTPVGTEPAGTEPADAAAAPAAPTGEDTFDIGGKKLSWAEALKSATPEQAELMKGIQAAFTRKQQALAEERRQFAADREARIKELEAKVKPVSELPAYDPYDEESVNARIEARFNADKLAELEALRAAHAMAQTEQAFATFTAEHPDSLEDPEIKSGIQKLLTENSEISFEDAYYRVAYRVSQERTAAARKRDAERKAAARQAATTGNGTTRTAAPGFVRPSPAELSRMSVAQILELRKSMS